MANQDWFDKDFYKILGVAKGVTDAELKKVYRKLARQFHPDSNPGDAKAEARFKEISEAYSVLSDAEQRKEYDAVRAMGGGARFTGGAGPGAGFPGGFPGGAGGGGFEDVFSNLFGGNRGGNPFGGSFGPQPGADLSMTTTLNFIDGVRGTSIKVNIAGKDVSVNIPAGVSDGQKIKLRGKGQASPNGGPAGDLIISCTVKPHPVFTRDGDNIRVIVPVKGRGVETPKHTGDLLATVEIAVPSHVSDKAKKALEQFESELPEEDPRADILLRAGLL